MMQPTTYPASQPNADVPKNDKPAQAKAEFEPKRQADTELQAEPGVQADVGPPATANPIVVPILPGLAITDQALSATDLKEHNIKALVTMRPSQPSAELKRALVQEAGIPETKTKVIKLTGYEEEDMVRHFVSICDFIDRVAPRRLGGSYSMLEAGFKKEWTKEDFEKLERSEMEDPEGTVLIHCSLGCYCAVTAAAAYLMRKYGALGGKGAVEFITTKIDLKTNRENMSYASAFYRKQLKIWNQVEWQPWTEDKKLRNLVPKEPYRLLSLAFAP